jgi:hypothetical protein
MPEVSRNDSMAKSSGSRPENGTRPPSKQPVARVSRAQATQRARAVNHVSPEQYAYVKNDLKWIATLAASMFVIIIFLHFLLPRLLPQ